VGLFSSAPELDQELAQLIIGEEGSARRSVEKIVAKNQADLPNLLEPGEEAGAIARGEGLNEILVITNRRLFRMKRGKMNWAPIPLDEVAETKLMTRDLGGGRVKYMLVVDTHTSKQYAHADERRFNPDHFFNIDFDDPQEARAVRGVIDLMGGSGR
jgi:hypothetical protein